jgi:hypothetical protein
VSSHRIEFNGVESEADRISILAYFDPNSESRNEHAQREKESKVNGENGVTNGQVQTPA